MRSIAPEHSLKKINVRYLREQDYEQISAIWQTSYPDAPLWSKAQFLKNLSLFPEGQVGIMSDTSLVGVCCSIIVNAGQHREGMPWQDLAVGKCLDSHDADGETLYAMSIFLDQKCAEPHLLSLLHRHLQDTVQMLNLKRIFMGSKLSGFHKYVSKMPVVDYLNRVMDGVFYDPALSPQLSDDFVVRRILPVFQPNRPEPLSYAVLLEWVNYEYLPEYFRKRIPSFL